LLAKPEKQRASQRPRRALLCMAMKQRIAARIEHAYRMTHQQYEPGKQNGVPCHRFLQS